MGNKDKFWACKTRQLNQVIIPELFITLIASYQKNILNFIKMFAMESIEEYKSELIDKLKIVKSEKLLNAIETILNLSDIEKVVSLTAAQLEMVEMGRNDVKNQNYISNAELKDRDSHWM